MTPRTASAALSRSASPTFPSLTSCSATILGKQRANKHNTEQIELSKIQFKENMDRKTTLVGTFCKEVRHPGNFHLLVKNVRQPAYNAPLPSFPQFLMQLQLVA